MATDVSPETGATFNRFNPVTGDIATVTRAFTIAEANAAVDRAAEAFPSGRHWVRTPAALH